MTDIETRIANAMRDDSLSEPDAMFRICVIRRIERARFRRHVTKAVLAAFSACVLAAVYAWEVIAGIVTKPDVWPAVTITIVIAGVIALVARAALRGTYFTVIAAICASIAIMPLAVAQTAPEPGYLVPRTSFGQPSFEGVWTSNFILPLEASPQAPMLTLLEPAAKMMGDAIAEIIADVLDQQLDPEVPELMKHTDGLAIVRGERRTRAVVLPENGMIPYTPEARLEASAAPGLGLMNNPEERPNWERCVASMGRAPVAATGESNPRQIIQTADHVIIFTEYGGEARIIPYTETHRPAMFRSALGDAIARWEGDTLVIETIRMSDHDRVRIFPTFIVSSDATVIERYTRLSENELLYQYTVEDPKVYAAPWLAEHSIYLTDQPMFEHACHEGNYSLPNILRGQRVADANRLAAFGANEANDDGWLTKVE